MRMKVTTGILGTVVFAKFTTGLSVAKTEYLTLLDKYYLLGLVVTCVIVLCCGVNSSWQNPWFDYAFGVAAAAPWLLLHAFVALASRFFLAPWPSIFAAQREKAKTS
eukprot:TRINITY_DN153_c0_g1_i13.p2 TRINITY_DN153_c0_g1~~TRINITY_DN153_c0_g1_i13.p2  ORF type:complete len:107 (+),score=37.01 TRINITY_DN153_c0_g1_i13:358-678(+)